MTGHAGETVRQRARDEVGDGDEEDRVQEAVRESHARAVQVLKQLRKDQGDTERNEDLAQRPADEREAAAAGAYEPNQIRRTSATVIADAVDDAEHDGQRRLDGLLPPT